MHNLLKKMIKKEIQNKVCSDFKGYSFLIELHNSLKDIKFETIILNFSDTTWFEANLCAVLGAIITDIQNNINNVKLINLQPNIEDIFSRNHFLASFGGSKIPDYKDTTIKYRKNKLNEEKLIKEFLNSELLHKESFPKLSSAAQKEVIRSIFEIYSNAIIHGDCKHVYSCGQLYPTKKPPRIDFTIVDLGRTIQRNVREFLNEDKSGKDAIRWALEGTNTTKPKDEKIPGGLGFKIIKDFVKLNKGKIQIVSSNGYWEYTHGEEVFNDLIQKFQGTVVNIEFNLNDDSFYFLKNENVEDIIF